MVVFACPKNGNSKAHCESSLEIYVAPLASEVSYEKARRPYLRDYFVIDFVDVLNLVRNYWGVSSVAHGSFQVILRGRHTCVKPHGHKGFRRRCTGKRAALHKPARRNLSVFWQGAVNQFLFD